MNPFSVNPTTQNITFELGHLKKKLTPSKPASLDQYINSIQEQSHSKLNQTISYIQDEQFLSREMEFTLESYYTNIGYDKKSSTPIQEYAYQFKPYQTLRQIQHKNSSSKYKKVMFANDHKNHYNNIKAQRRLFFRKVEDLIYFSLGKMQLGTYKNLQSEQFYTLFCCRKTKPEVNMPSYLQSIEYTNRLAYLHHIIVSKQIQFQVFENDEFQRIKKLIEDQIFQIEAMYYWSFQEFNFLQKSFEEIQTINKEFKQMQIIICAPQNMLCQKKKYIEPEIQQQRKQQDLLSSFYDQFDVQNADQVVKTDKLIQLVDQSISEQDDVVVQINDQSDSSIINIPKKMYRQSLSQLQKQIDNRIITQYQIDYVEKIQQIMRSQIKSDQPIEKNKSIEQIDKSESIKYIEQQYIDKEQQHNFVSVQVINKTIVLKKQKFGQNTHKIQQQDIQQNKQKHNMPQSSQNQMSKIIQTGIALTKQEQIMLGKIMQQDIMLESIMREQIMNRDRLIQVPENQSQMQAQQAKQQHPRQIDSQIGVRQKQDNPLKQKQDSPFKQKQDSPLKQKQDNPFKQNQEKQLKRKQSEEGNQQIKSHRNQGLFFPTQSKKQKDVSRDIFDY